MRILLLIKWVGILVLMFLAIVLAAPLFTVFMLMDEERTAAYLQAMGDRLQSYIRVDFDRR